MKKNLLFLMLMAFLFSFESMSQCGYVSLIGEFNGWADDHYMTQDPMDPTDYSTIISFTAAMDTDGNDTIEVKFRENGDWAVNWGGDTFPSGIAIENGPNNILVPLDPDTIGYTTDFKVTFNYETLEYNFEAICGSIGLIGEFNAWADDLAMTRDMADMASWSAILSLTAAMDADGNDTIELKFRESANWTVNWGGEGFPSGTGVNGGPNILVPLDTGNVYTTDFLVTFNCESGDYNFESVCGSIGLIGEFNEWSDDYAMHRDMDNPDEWSVVFTLTDDMDTDDNDTIEVKFRESADWTVNWGGDGFPSGIGVQEGPNIFVPLDTIGITTDYYVTFNCSTGEYNFQSTCGDIGVIGWFINWNGDIPMNRDADDPDVWTLSRSWGVDSEVKFRENADWSVNWGSPDWPSGVGVPNGSINIPLVAGKYDVTFNCGTFEYNFVENADICGEIGMIGDFNEWGGTNPADPPTDIYLVRDPMYPTLFSLEYSFSSSTKLLFRVDADPIASNWWGGSFPMGQAVQDPSLIINVPGGLYDITYNCLSNTFSFIQLGNSVTAPNVFSINVDGILNESDWDISQPVSKMIYGEVTGDLNEAFFGVAYNEEYLYIGIDVTDTIPTFYEQGELFVDGNKSGGDYDSTDLHVMFSAAGLTVIHGPDDMEAILGFVPGATGYSAEVAIPWDAIYVTAEEGGQIGFDIILGDSDTGDTVNYKLAWNGGLQNYESTSSFGDLLFGTLSCGCISIYNETTGDVVLRNPTDMPTTYVGTYELDADYNMVFRKDMQATVHWGATDFPSGTAVLDGDEIPATTGRYRVTFDCLSGVYSFVDEPAGDSTAYAQFTETTPVVDGDLSEYNLEYGCEVMAVTTGPDNNNTVTWGALWDLHSFYIGVKVVDAVVEGSGNPWDNDAIEFYIDGNHDSDGPYDSDFDTQLIMDALNNGLYPDTLWVKADGVPITDYDAYWTATADGYNCELRIGWNNIDFYPGRNRTIGWSLGNNDSDNGVGRDYQTVWFGTGNNWSNTGDLGDLQLAGGPYHGIHDVVYYNAQFVLYPNPSNGTTYLRTMGDIFDGEVSIYITDLSGRTVVVQSERLFGSNDVITLNTNNLESGLYLINILGADGKKAVKKLIIQ
jgi:hypothetical protein